MLLIVLYRLAEWHALAKLRMHTEHTLQALETLTTTLGREMRRFRDETLKAFNCQELPKETTTRQRRRKRAKAKNAENQTTSSKGKSHKEPPLAPKKKCLNIFTYKFHALGDYVRTIRLFGTTDSYSTQIVCPKSFFSIAFSHSSLSIGRVSTSPSEALLHQNK